jgi:hypothetical protein
MKLNDVFEILKKTGVPLARESETAGPLDDTNADEQFLADTVFRCDCVPSPYTEAWGATTEAPQEAVASVPSVLFDGSEKIVTETLIVGNPILQSGHILTTRLRMQDKRVSESGPFELGLAFDFAGAPLEFPTGEEINGWGDSEVSLLIPSEIARAWKNQLPWEGGEEPDWSKIPFRFTLRPVIRN